MTSALTVQINFEVSSHLYNQCDILLIWLDTNSDNTVKDKHNLHIGAYVCQILCTPLLPNYCIYRSKG